MVLNSKLTSFILIILAWAGVSNACLAQQAASAIRLNQLGFYPDAPKIAIVSGPAQGSYSIISTETKKPVFGGKLSEERMSSISGKSTRSADFSAFDKPGKYLLTVPGVGESYPFEIKPNVHLDMATAALKSFYFQRMSTPLPKKYAGAWHRGAGHPDKRVLVHPSAVSEKRPAGTVIASPGGWYDAGDYNKYSVNSGITMGTLLSLYEDFPDYFKKLDTNIPESGDAVPDLLDEVNYNLRWMLTMQDPNDGGVYHKCTTAAFEGFIKPEDAKDTRYVVQKSTAAAHDFAAVMAQAARVYKPFDRAFPGLSDTCLKAAKAAWNWAAANPNVVYDQEKLNGAFDPDITTGAYGGNDLSDERIWAAVELYVSTGEDSYLQAVELFPAEFFTVQNWGDVRTMAYFTLLRHKDALTPAGAAKVPTLAKMYEGFAKGLVMKTAEQAHLAPMENDVKNYVWGSTAVCANQGIALVYAYQLTKDEKYLDYALADLDYILGRNPTGYSFVTGYGSKTPMHPHHRPSDTDGVEAPVPGLLSGGPNPKQQDKCPGYPNNLPDESYVDAVCSYASNEIAINWNAPLVYLAFAMEILKSKN